MTSIEPLPPALRSMWRLCLLGYRQQPRLMVASFLLSQLAALPAALCGIVWMLFVTGTHISVPALTGSIMTMGVATANSILVISFAREQMEANAGDAYAAALRAG